MNIRPITLCNTRFNTQSQSLKSQAKQENINLTINNAVSYPVRFYGIPNTNENIPLDGGPLGLMNVEQLIQCRKNIIREVEFLLKNEYSDAKAERLDKLLNSYFMDYSTKCIGDDKSLNDILSSYNKDDTNKLYGLFVATSLAQTHPNITKIDNYKDLYKNNAGIAYVLNNYLENDENTKEAATVRKMIIRLLDNDVEIPYNKYFAECLLNGKIQMCKTLYDTGKISPMAEIPVITTEMSNELGNTFEHSIGTEGFSKVYKDPRLVSRGDDPTYFMIIYGDLKLSPLLRHRTTETLFQISGMSEHSECRNFFDMPEYLSSSYIGKTDFLWFKQDGCYEKCYGVKFFDDMNNYYSHPEIYGVDFWVQLISKIQEKTGKEADDLRIPYVRHNHHLNNESLQKLKISHDNPSQYTENEKKILNYINRESTNPDRRTLNKLILENLDKISLEDLQNYSTYSELEDRVKNRLKNS